jgi:hypothetical protein
MAQVLKWRPSGSLDSLCLFGAEQVHRHLELHEVRYLQFAFRWMNNLLMREVPLRCTIRLWDTYQVSSPLHPPVWGLSLSHSAPAPHGVLSVET